MSLTSTSKATAVHRVEVAVPVPTTGTYTFTVPPEISHNVRVGQRVIVPFQGRLVVSYVAGLDPPELPGIKLKPISLIVDEFEPTFTPPMVEFLIWVARYYHAPVGDVFKGAHPSGTNAKSEPCLTLVETDTSTLPGMLPTDLQLCISALRANEGTLPIAGLPVMPSANDIKKWVKLGIVKKSIALKSARVKHRTEAQWTANYTAPTAPRGRGGRMLKRDLLHAEIAKHGPIRISKLRTLSAYSAPALKQLSQEQAIQSELVSVAIELFPGPPVPRDVAPRLNQEQAHAVDTIIGCQEFKGFLLRGVTGSGKTEVYLHLIEETLKRGQGALVLVPEIALTPQLVTRFRARLGDQIAVLHSGMTDQKRLAHWSRLQSGEVNLAIGARSAVFAPVKNLGMIVVDEEHDHSFKQGEGVRYRTGFGNHAGISLKVPNRAGLGDPVPRNAQ